MKVCILNSVHPVSDTRVLKIATTLSDTGHQVTILSPSVQVSSTNLQELEGRLKLVEVERPKGQFRPSSGLVAFLKTLLSRLMVSIQLFRQGWQLKADVYHCNEVDSWLVGILLKILLRKRVVFDVHEYYPSHIIALLPGGLLSHPLESLLLKFFAICSRLTDGAVFTNQTRADLYKFQCPQIIVRHCVSLKHADGINQRDLALETSYKGRVVLLHVGLLRDTYGTEQLIETMRLLCDVPNLVCVILGGIYDPCNTIQRKLADLDLNERLEIVEKVPFEQVVQYLNVADIGLIVVQPCRKSFVTSLARKFLEYIAFGVPIVASDFPEMRRIVEKYEVGLLVNPEDPQDIARAIKILIQDPSMRSRMKANSRAAFENELNWEIESQSLIKLYASWS